LALKLPLSIFLTNIFWYRIWKVSYWRMSIKLHVTCYKTVKNNYTLSVPPQNYAVAKFVLQTSNLSPLTNGKMSHLSLQWIRQNFKNFTWNFIWKGFSLWKRFIFKNIWLTELSFQKLSYQKCRPTLRVKEFFNVGRELQNSSARRVVQTNFSKYEKQGIFINCQQLWSDLSVPKPFSIIHKAKSILFCILGEFV